MMKKNSLLAGCCALIIGFNCATASADNLVEVYKQAFQNDPTFKEAEASWLAAKENIPIAFANLLPALDINGGYSRIYTDLGGATSSGNATQYGATIGLPIINFANWAALRGAKDTTKSAAATYAAAAQDLMFRTVQAYVNVLQADDILYFTLAQKRAIQEEFKNSKQKYDAGITPITGVYQAQASYDAIIATEISNRNTLANNLQNLKAITGNDYVSLSGISHQIPLVTPQPNNMQEWVSIAQKQNPQIQAQHYLVLAARDNIKQQQAGFIPTVSATADYNYASADQLLGNELTKSASAGLSADYPIYSGGGTLAATRQARYNYVNASATLEYTHRSVVNQTSQAFLTIQALISQIKADLHAITSAEASYKATQLGYVAGTQPMLNVLQDLSNVYQSKQQYANDQYTYILNIVTLKQAAGTLDFNDISEINSWLKANKPVRADAGQASGPIAEAPKKTKAAAVITNPSHTSGSYTLQIAAFPTQAEADAFINKYPNESLTTFTKNVQGKTWYSAGYGKYSTSKEAQSALKNLPQSLKQFKPWAARLS